jgi:hypothetical protein
MEPLEHEAERGAVGGEPPRSSPVMSVPPTSMMPLSGASIAPSKCSRVDLPDPLGPVSAAVSPAARSRLTSLTAMMGTALPER